MHSAQHPNVRNPDAFALKIARDLISQQTEADEQRAESQRLLERIEQCPDCTTGGYVEREGEWVRCPHPSLEGIDASEA